MIDYMDTDADKNIARKLKDDQRQEIALLVFQRWQDASDKLVEGGLTADSQEGWNFLLRNYPNKSVGSQKKDLVDANRQQSKGLRMGAIPKVVESMLAFMHNATFPKDDRFFRAIAQNDYSNDPELQERYEVHMARCFGISNVPEQMRLFRMSQIVDGTAAAKVVFKRRKTKKTEYKAKPVKDSINVLGVSIPFISRKVVAETKDVIDWEGTVMEVLDFNDWRVDQSATSMDDSWFIRRWYESKSVIEHKYPWVDEDKITTWRQCFDEKSDTEKRQHSGLLEIPRAIDPQFEPDGNLHALMMACYGDFIIGGKEYKDHCAVVMNGLETLWFGPYEDNHGRMPYIVAPYKPIPNQIMGESAIKHALPHSEVIDQATSDALSVLRWAGKPLFGWNAKDKALRKLLAKGRLDVKQGMSIPMESRDSLWQIPISIADIQFMDGLIQRSVQMIEDLTGVSPFISGEAPDQGRVSAFEIDQRVQGGNSRYNAIMTAFDNNVLEPFLQMAFENDRQYKEKTENVDGKDLSPDDIKLLDYKFIITSTQATLTRNRRLANLKAFLTEILPLLVQGGIATIENEGVKVKPLAAVRRLLIEGGLSDADEFIEAAQGMNINPEGMDTGGGNPGGLPSVAPTPNEQAAIAG